MSRVNGKVPGNPIRRYRNCLLQLLGPAATNPQPTRHCVCMSIRPICRRSTARARARVHVTSIGASQRRFGRRSRTAQAARCSDCARRSRLLRPKVPPHSGEVAAELSCSHWLDIQIGLLIGLLIMLRRRRGVPKKMYPPVSTSTYKCSPSRNMS